MGRLRDRIICWLWPDLWYKLNTTFTEEECQALEEVQAFGCYPKKWYELNMIRLKINPLRQKFYDKEYAEKIKKEWGV